VLGSDYSGLDCSIARALEAVGERWTLLIVRELLRRPRRFTDLERTLPISKNVLAARLDKLVRIGVVEKVAVDPARDWNTYRLTSKGLDLFPVVSALMAWGDAWDAPDGPPAVLEHSCGHPAGHLLVCSSCAEQVDTTNVRTVAGPGYHRSEAAGTAAPAASEIPPN